MRLLSTDANSQRLPFLGNLSLAYFLSLIIFLVMATVSLGGLAFPTVLYPTEEVLHSYLTNDLVSLLVGLPILLGSMGLAWRGKQIGLLCWPGALLYVFYNYLAYSIGVPFSLVTLVFGLLVLLSGSLVFYLMRSIDRKVMLAQLKGAVSEKLSGGILLLFGTAFFFLAINLILAARTEQIALPMTDLGVAVADIALSVLLAAGGALLFLRKPLGYVSGLGLLFATSSLFIGAILVVLLQPVLTGMPVVLGDVVALAGMGMVCFVPTGLFMRAAISKS